MAFTNKKFTAEDKKAIIDGVIGSEEAKEKILEEVQSTVEEVAETKAASAVAEAAGAIPSEDTTATPAVTAEGEEIIVTIAGTQYTVDEATVVTSESEEGKKIMILVPKA